jgi:hypothetical protein
LQVGHGADDVREASAEPVKTPHDDGVPGPSVGEQLRQAITVLASTERLSVKSSPRQRGSGRRPVDLKTVATQHKIVSARCSATVRYDNPPQRLKSVGNCRVHLEDVV